MTVTIEPIHKKDNDALCHIIQSVGAEYGAVGDGFGPSDPEVQAMSEHYTEDMQSHYLVARVEGELVGGCGVGPFMGSSEVCELKKLYLLPSGRGRDLGRKLSEQCLEYAREKGFKQCYLDTLSNMQAAIRLYEKLGFEHLDTPLEGAEHSGCDTWMIKPL